MEAKKELKICYQIYVNKINNSSLENVSKYFSHLIKLIHYIKQNSVNFLDLL